MGWLEEWFDRANLPDKFYLHGHSYGGYLSYLYARRNPHKILKLFLNSPVGTDLDLPEIDPL